MIRNAGDKTGKTRQLYKIVMPCNLVPVSYDNNITKKSQTQRTEVKLHETERVVHSISC